jgi:hypothetical protein
MLRKRRQAKLEGITGIRNQGSRQQLCLRKERTTSNCIREHSKKQEPRLVSRTTLGRTFRKTVELEVTKQIAGTSINLQKMSDWTLWRGRSPLKRRSRSRSIDHSRNFWPHQLEEDDGDEPGPTTPYEGTARDKQS